MNPFDLRGPEFLLFYFCFASLVLLALLLSRRIGSASSSARPPMDDPYFVAFLRGGELECVRVATLVLMDRGLLAVKPAGSLASALSFAENRLETTDPQAASSVTRPLEKEILEAFRTAAPVSSTLDSLQYSTPCTDYRARLEKLSLIHSEDERDNFQRRIWAAVALLAAVALFKVFLAMIRGHSNILFLIILAALAIYAATRVTSPFRTPAGDRLLDSFHSLFSNLRARARMLRSGGASTDLVWLASVFGLTAVPVSVFPHSSALMTRTPPPGGSSDSGFFSNSSCGSSGCGGGCGGGGCGGGCGGCGS